MKEFVFILLLAPSTFAQQTVGLVGANPDGRLNQDLAQARSELRRKSASKDVVVFIGDRVLPQFVDGGFWQTAITVINLENKIVSCDVLFFNDNGTDLIVPVVGQGPIRGIHITLGVAASVTFQTTGTNSGLSAGWALLSQTTNDSIGIYGIFRQTIGPQPQEAVVPAVNQFSDHFVLPFDNTLYVTGIALANPTSLTVSIPANIRNESGQVIDTRQIVLGPYSHTSFGLPSTWNATSGIRGAIEFVTSGFGVGALGLRFNGAAFTSLNVLQNFNWAVR